MVYRDMACLKRSVYAVNRIIMRADGARDSLSTIRGPQ